MAQVSDVLSALDRLDASAHETLERFSEMIAEADAQRQEVEEETSAFTLSVAGMGEAAESGAQAAIAAAEARLKAIEGIVVDVDDGTINTAAQKALDDLETELDSLAEAIALELGAARDRLIDGMAEVADKFADLDDFATNKIGQAVGDAFDTLLERTKHSVADLPKETLGLIEDQFGEAFGALKGAAGDIAQRSMDHVDQLREELTSAVEARGRDLFDEQIKEIGETVITNTLNEVFEDIALTQISAQITGMLSAQLPQLVVAKNVVGAVKRGLEIMRAGF